MPGSSQISGPVAYDGNDLRFVAENDSVSLVRSKANWYIARDEIEERSPSRKDGIDSAKEHELRKSYCSFLRDFGIKLRMPHVVIATSTVFCHRFYLHQSHHKNDRYTIATACMFLAGKVEEARRALEEVVLLSYCLQNKNNPVAAEEFKEKEICERQKELVLLAEQVVLVTLDFNLKVRHPYSFILLATSKYKSASDTLFRVSCIILNDALYTTLCLQFKPQHIAASALLLAAKLLKFKFPSKGWWKEFNVKLCQLEEICSQILELYEQERAPFSIVQSSSSSSSVDDKAKVLSESIAAGDLVRCGLPQPHLMDNSAASLSSIRLTKNNRSGLPGSAGHPSSTSLPATGQKLGFKVSPKILPNNSKLKSSDSETPAKRKRPDDDNGTGNLQQLSRHKQSVIPRKGK